tara:strand:- start:333 stop:1061 length:729 start_codon:yes stop_codon:yes gene_type:complete
MAKHNFKMSDVTGDARVLARSALGYDFNYFADDETLIFGTGSDATLSWDGDSLNVTSAATEVSGTLAVAGATSLGTTEAVSAGTGITTGTNTVYKSSVVKVGGIFETNIYIDLTGLSSNAPGDIIGKASTANSHIGQITAAVNGTIVGGYMQCLETPTTGEPDIDLFYADEATGTEDAAVSGLSNQVSVLAAAADWTIAANVNMRPLSAIVAADKYLYLVGGGGTTDGVYDAGKYLIKLYGV